MKHQNNLLEIDPEVQTLGEEIANSVTHGIGAALSVAALVLLVVYASLYGDAWRVVSFSIYGTSLIILYLASTFYHAFTNERVKSLFRILDHSSIYILIAGTYTPISLVLLQGAMGWTVFGLIWGMAVTGIICKIFLTGKYKVISLIFYVLMGWLIVIAIGPLFANSTWGFLMWLMIGGACYTVGIAFYVWNSLPYNHTIWHLFVLGGSVTHFFGVFFHLSSV